MEKNELCIRRLAILFLKNQADPHNGWGMGIMADMWFEPFTSSRGFQRPHDSRNVEPPLLDDWCMLDGPHDGETFQSRTRFLPQTDGSHFDCEASGGKGNARKQVKKREARSHKQAGQTSE